MSKPDTLRTGAASEWKQRSCTRAAKGENWRPLGLNESFEETFRTNARALRTADHLVPLYDHQVFERYPGGIISRGPAGA